MLALTIRQPWASLIILGQKTIETRTWATDYRGPLAIHAGATLDEDGCDWLGREPAATIWLEALMNAGYPTRADLPRGQILGSAELVACRKNGGLFAWELARPIEWYLPERAQGLPGLWDCMEGIRAAERFAPQGVRAA